MGISYDDLQKYLTEKGADFDDISQPNRNSPIKNLIYDISMSWGDWKHGWGYLRYLMGELNYVEISHKITEDNGSDCWSGVSRFAFKPCVDIFK